MHKAIGARFHAVLVDNGFLRHNERAEVVERLKTKVGKSASCVVHQMLNPIITGINLHSIDASKRFHDKLEGVTDPEEKRKKIGNLFIEVSTATSALQAGS